MQILLVRDAKTPVRQIELTPGRMFKWVCLFLIGLIFLNLLVVWLLEAMGLDDREQRQSLAEAQYEHKLIELEAQLAEMNARLKGLDATRQQMMQDQPSTPLQPGSAVSAPAVPVPIAPSSQGGQGGPMISQVALPADRSFTTRLHQLELAALNIKADSEQVTAQMQTLQKFKLAMPRMATSK